MALKLPGGDAFAYMDSNTAEDPDSGKLLWTLGYAWAATAGVPLASTLQQLYKHPVSLHSISSKKQAVNIMAFQPEEKHW